MRLKMPNAVYVVVDEEGVAEMFAASAQAEAYRAWLRDRHKPSLVSQMRRYQLTVGRKTKVRK